jgi:hypothetical protein
VQPLKVLTGGPGGIVGAKNHPHPSVGDAGEDCAQVPKGIGITPEYAVHVKD